MRKLQATHVQVQLLSSQCFQRLFRCSIDFYTEGHDVKGWRVCKACSGSGSLNGMCAEKGLCYDDKAAAKSGREAGVVDYLAKRATGGGTCFLQRSLPWQRHGEQDKLLSGGM